MTLIFIIIILFFSSFIRSTFGFGDALIAMPLLAFFLPLSLASPLVAVFSTVIATYIIIRNYKQINFRCLWQLVIFTIIFTPAGAFFVKFGGDTTIKILLASILMLFALYNLLKPNLLKLTSDKYAWAFGIIAGFLGGAYNTNGPPIIIYGVMRKWNPKEFRANLQGVFFPANFFIIINHILMGNWTPEVLEYSALALPFVVGATILGDFLSRKIPAEKFRNSIFILIIAIAVVLIYSLL